MRLTDFKVLSFACYGTLIDRDSGIWAALRPLLASARIDLDRNQVLTALGRHESALESGRPDLPYSELLTEAHRALAKDWGLQCSDAEHEVFGKSVPNWPAFADVPAGLQYIKRYFKIVVLTNGDRSSLRGSIRRLDAQFDAVYTAQDIGSYKPDPRNFRYLIDHLCALGYAPDAVLHAAESRRKDREPAQRCGLATAWIDRHPIHTDAGIVENAKEPGTGLHFRSVVDIVRAHQEALRI